MKSDIEKEIEALSTVISAVRGLEESKQRWIFTSAMSNLGLLTTPTHLVATPNALGQSAIRDASQDPSPKEFMREKSPKTDVQRVLCLGYYLSQFRGQSHFKTKDLGKLNIEAAGLPFSNLSQAVDNAAKQSRYFVSAGAGSKQLGPIGEDVVAALPNQVQVKELDGQRPKKRKPRARAK